MVWNKRSSPQYRYNGKKWLSHLDSMPWCQMRHDCFALKLQMMVGVKERWTFLIWDSVWCWGTFKFLNWLEGIFPLNVQSRVFTPEPYSDLLTPTTFSELLWWNGCGQMRQSTEESRKPLMSNCKNHHQTEAIPNGIPCSLAAFSQYKS